MWKSFHRLAGVKADELDVIVATQATTAATDTEDIRMLRDAVLVRSIGEGALFKYLCGRRRVSFCCHGAGWTVRTTSRTRGRRCPSHVAHFLLCVDPTTDSLLELEENKR